VTGGSPIPVVFDVNVLVGAAAGGNSPFRSWPSPPPTSGNPFADCLGIIVDAAEFALWLSPHILDNIGRVLVEGLKWPADRTERYLSVILEVADHSGGGVVDPPSTVHDCQDREDNQILDLTVEFGALLVVSDDADLTSMSPWRGTPILRPREFTAKVDGMRRHRRRSHRTE
jgi:predicted nucleic acid-binding protein